jgi:hypothetical protein
MPTSASSSLSQHESDLRDWREKIKADAARLGGRETVLQVRVLVKPDWLLTILHGRVQLGRYTIGTSLFTSGMR